VQYLGLGDTKVETFAVLSADGTACDVVVTIIGTNDAAVIGGVKIGDVTEDTLVTEGSINAFGTLTSTDVDGTPDAFLAGVGVAVGSTLGSLSIDAAGTWS
jgi:hypothetical protein